MDDNKNDSKPQTVMVTGSGPTAEEISAALRTLRAAEALGQLIITREPDAEPEPYETVEVIDPNTKRSLKGAFSKGAFSKGTLLDEKEARLQPLVNKAKAMLDKVTADKAADASDVDEKIKQLKARIELAESKTRDYRERADHVGTSIAAKREEIAWAERDLQHITVEMIPAAEFKHQQLISEMTETQSVRDSIDRKWHRKLHAAEKEHRSLSLRLTRVQLRKPRTTVVIDTETEKPKAVAPTKLANGLHTMPGPTNEGNA